MELDLITIKQRFIIIMVILKINSIIWIGEYLIQHLLQNLLDMVFLKAVDRGKLPILHSTWCKDFDYPYRVSSKKEFIDIYNKVCNDTYETKNYWFKKIKNYMIDNYSNKQLWIDSLLDIYNI